jgi:hypothetical protein
MSLIEAMVELASILLQIPAGPSEHGEEDRLFQHSLKNTDLLGRLAEWKDSLPPELDLESSPLDEGELITKQKIVLKLREHFMVRFKILC